MNNHYENWEKYLFSLKKENDFKKELNNIKTKFGNNINRDEYPLWFYKYISTLKFYGTLFCDDFDDKDYYEFMDMKKDIIEKYTFIRINFFNYNQKAENQIGLYFQDLEEIEKFLNKNLKIDNEADEEVHFWLIKKRYFNEITIEDEYSDSEEDDE